MSVPTQQSWKNQSKSYFAGNPAVGDLNMNGYSILNTNDIRSISLNVSAVGAISALATNSITTQSENVLGIGIVSSLGANIGTLSAMVTQTATMIPFSSGVGSIEIGNNAAAPSTASYKLTCADTTVGGLTATNLDMFAYASVLPGPVRIGTVDVSGNWTLGKSMGVPIASMSVATATTSLLISAPTLRAVQTGSRSGTFICTGSTPLNVPCTGITTNSIVLLTVKTVVGASGGCKITQISPGATFTVVSDGSDTSTYNYMVIDIA